MPSGSGPYAPPRCPTVGASVVSLAPLAQRLGAWLVFPSLSRWLTQTIILSYAIHIARHPPRFSGIGVADKNAPVLVKYAIELVPPAALVPLR